MGLFKSKEERRLERQMEIRRGINAIKRQIKQLRKHEKDYLKKAVRARELGDSNQLRFLKQTVKRTIGQRMMMERQLLSIETANQIKNQAEAYGSFAKSMTAVSTSISEVFGATDFNETQKSFERAMHQAESMEQRMDIFLDMANESMGAESITMDEAVSDETIDRMLDAATPGRERVVDKDIAQGLSEIEKELGSL